MKRRKALLIRISEIKVILQKIFILFLFLCAFLFLIFSKFNQVFVNKITDFTIAISGPVMHIVEFPARVIHRAYTFVYDMSNIMEDNRVLRDENKQMMMLQNKVRTLEVENQLLTKLLNYIPPAEASFVSAKIIAETGDIFTHTLIIYIGDEVVKKGQIVLGYESVIGRIDSVSGKYAKVILVTDINSKIPVVIERTRIRGILSGNNTSMPTIIFARSTDDIQEGDVVVTSGVGGLFPAGLPIGLINSTKDKRIEVETIADISRLEYVRIVDYGLSNETQGLDDFLEEKNGR